MIGNRTYNSLKNSARSKRRTHVPVSARTLAIGSILLGSLTAIIPMVASMPILPPFGLLTFVAWRVLRPHLLPNWSGVLFGLFDDLVSGNPIGTAMFLWGALSIAIDSSERYFPWRGFYHDWVISGISSTIYILMAALFGSAGTGTFDLLLFLPQILISICAAPLVMRLVVALDRRASNP